MENLPIEPGEMQARATFRVLLPKERTAIPIYLDEWESLVDRIESCKVSTRLWSVAYSVAFAVGVTSGLSILPIGFANLPSWVMSVYVGICLLGLGVGISCVIAQRTLEKTQHAQIDDLTDEMARIKQTFPDPTTPQKE